MIHPTAIIDKKAEVDENVNIGPYCIISGNVKISEGTNLHSHVVIEGDTEIGKNNTFYPYSSVGIACQDLKYNFEPTKLKIGDNNTFREHVTVHRGTVQDKGITIIGNNNLFMINSHIAHDVDVGNNCIIANNVPIAGHVKIHNNVYFGGNCAVHQFCKIGSYSFISGGTMVVKDIPPYIIAEGHRARPRGINIEGLKRQNFSLKDSLIIKDFYKILYKENNTIQVALEKLSNLPESKVLQHGIDFLKESKRGIIRGT